MLTRRVPRISQPTHSCNNKKTNKQKHTNNQTTQTFVRRQRRARHSRLRLRRRVKGLCVARLSRRRGLGGTGDKSQETSPQEEEKITVIVYGGNGLPTEIKLDKGATVMQVKQEYEKMTGFFLRGQTLIDKKNRAVADTATVVDADNEYICLMRDKTELDVLIDLKNKMTRGWTQVTQLEQQQDDCRKNEEEFTVLYKKDNYLNGHWEVSTRDKTVQQLNLKQCFFCVHTPIELPDLSALTNLTNLTVSGNQLTSLPNMPTNLTNLTVSGNQLTSLPPNMSELTNLTNLSATNNQLTSLPPNMSALMHLNSLYVSSNQLKSLPPNMSELTNLERLDVSSNQLTLPLNLDLPEELDIIW